MPTISTGVVFNDPIGNFLRGNANIKSVDFIAVNDVQITHNKKSPDLHRDLFVGPLGFR
jgi:hypothetical protein